MKNFIYFILLHFVFLGCATNVINLPEYKNSSFQTNDNIVLIINDLKEKDFIASYENISGSENIQIYTNENLSLWLKKAIQNKLEKYEISLTNDENLADFIVSVNIKNLQISLNGISSDNLQANAQIELVFKQDLQVSESLSFSNKDYTLIPTFSALEEFSILFLDEIANSIAIKIRNIY